MYPNRKNQNIQIVMCTPKIFYHELKEKTQAILYTKDDCIILNFLLKLHPEKGCMFVGVSLFRGAAVL